MTVDRECDSPKGGGKGIVSWCVSWWGGVMVMGEI